MKEIFERLFSQVPIYFEALFSLLTGPKRFVAERLAREGSRMQDALLFLAISFALGWILKLPMSRGDPLLELGTDAVFVLLYVVAYGLAIYLSWRIVGGARGLARVLTIHFYFAGVFLLLLSATYLGMVGIIRAVDPGLLKEINDATMSGNLAAFLLGNRERLIANPAYRLSSGAQIAGFAAMLAWTVAGWGAYRQLNRLSRLRSLLAGLLFLLLCVPVTAFFFVVGNALVK